jgi:hypothetical protein
VLCPKRNSGEKCPICDLVSQLFNEGTDSSKEQAMEIRATARYFTPVIVREHPEYDRKPVVWTYPPTIYKELIDKVLDPDYGENLNDPEQGFDLKLRYEKENGRMYPTQKIDFARKESRLVPRGEDYKEILDAIPDINSLYSIPSYEEVKEILNNFLNGRINEASEVEDSDGEEKYFSEEDPEQKAIDEALSDIV